MDKVINRKGKRDQTETERERNDKNVFDQVMRRDERCEK